MQYILPSRSLTPQDAIGEFSTALLPRLGLKSQANSSNQLKQVDDPEVDDVTA